MYSTEIDTKRAENVVFLLYENKINFAKRGKRARPGISKSIKALFTFRRCTELFSYESERERLSLSPFLSSYYKKVLLRETLGKRSTERNLYKFNDIFYITLFSTKHSFLLPVSFECYRCNIINLHICLIRMYYYSQCY